MDVGHDVLATLRAAGRPFVATRETAALAALSTSSASKHLHGLAGDLAAEDLGQVSLIASDLIQYLPEAFQMTT